LRRQRKHAFHHVLGRQLVEPMEGQPRPKALERPLNLRDPETLQGRVADRDRDVGRLGEDAQDIVDLERRIDRDRNGCIVRCEFAIGENALVRSGDEQGF
jgi:hypothetical protein